MEKEKIGLVLSGGGMWGHYNHGVLDALVNLFQTNLRFECIIAASISSSLGAYLATNQLQYIHGDFRKHCLNKNIFNPLNVANMLNTDQLVDTIHCDTDNPLDMNALNISSSKLLIPSWNHAVGEIRYFDAQKDELDDGLKTTHALPCVVKKQYVDNKRYRDSVFSAFVYFHIDRLLYKEGVSKVIVINCIPFEKPFVLYERLLSLGRKASYRKAIRTHISKLKHRREIFRHHMSQSVLFLEPSIKIPFFCRNEEKLKSAYRDGLSFSAQKQKTITDFLFNKPLS